MSEKDETTVEVDAEVLETAEAMLRFRDGERPEPNNIVEEALVYFVNSHKVVECESDEDGLSRDDFLTHRDINFEPRIGLEDMEDFGIRNSIFEAATTGEAER